MAEYEDRSSAVDPAVDDPRRPRRHVTVGSKNLLDWLALLPPAPQLRGFLNRQALSCSCHLWSLNIMLNNDVAMTS
ncbi:MAG: hypothetical protein ACXWJJ_09820 [Ramlibacter sp.]